MPSVVEINAPDELAARRLLWNALLGQTRGATFFHCLDWLQVYWRHFSPRLRLRVLVVHSAGEPVGVLPLVRQSRPSCFGSVRALAYPLGGFASFCGPLGSNATATLHVGLEHIRRTPRDWDVLDLRGVDEAGSDRGRTRRAMQAAGFRPASHPGAHSAVVDQSGTWTDYWQSRPAPWRRKLARLRKALARRGRVRLLRYRPGGRASGDDDPRWDLAGPCLGHEPEALLLRDVHRTATGMGAADVNVLLVDDQPVARAVNVVFGGRVLGLCRWHDPDWDEFDPEDVLMGMALEDGFRRGDRLFDLGPRPAQAMCPWQTGTSTRFRYTYYPAGVPKAQVLRLRDWMQARAAVRTA